MNEWLWGEIPERNDFRIGSVRDPRGDRRRGMTDRIRVWGCRLDFLFFEVTRDRMVSEG